MQRREASSSLPKFNPLTCVNQVKFTPPPAKLASMEFWGVQNGIIPAGGHVGQSLPSSCEGHSDEWTFPAVAPTSLPPLPPLCCALQNCNGAPFFSRAWPPFSITSPWAMEVSQPHHTGFLDGVGSMHRGDTCHSEVGGQHFESKAHQKGPVTMIFLYSLLFARMHDSRIPCIRFH